MNLLRSNSFVRVVLIIYLLYYISGMGFFPVGGKKAAAQTLTVEAANGGIGGGIAPGTSFGNADDLIEEDMDLELSGIPEPEEYSRPHMLTYSYYSIEKGDIIGNIAVKTGLNEDTLISVNNIKNTRLIQINQIIKIPNQDGISYTVQAGDTLEGIAEKYNTTAARISTVNELFSDALAVNASLFIPGAKMDWMNRQEINGDLFIWPCAGYISSPYGFRTSPFNDTRQFHSGLDIGAPHGTPVRAAMAGRVSQVGYDDSFGNYVVISHHSGYRTLYAHLSVVRVNAGTYAAVNERIGDVGSTGLSTGPHLHFTVYKDGVTVNPRVLMK